MAGIKNVHWHKAHHFGGGDAFMENFSKKTLTLCLKITLQSIYDINPLQLLLNVAVAASLSIQTWGFIIDID